MSVLRVAGRVFDEGGSEESQWKISKEQKLVHTPCLLGKSRGALRQGLIATRIRAVIDEPKDSIPDRSV